MAAGTREKIHGHLRIATEISFLPPAGFHHVGSIAVTFRVQNTTAIPAEIPFLSFSKLGLKLVPHSGWRRENRTTASGKHSIVFSPVGGSLLPGRIDSACALHMDVIARGGGALRLTLGQERSAWDQSDINIQCSSGGGNFPLEVQTMTICGTALSNAACTALQRHKAARAAMTGAAGPQSR